jgi:fibronectin-binding autotransporter adhesin
VSISAASGHILNSVQYFGNNGQLLGESATPPYSVITTNLNAGAFKLFARLFYDGGFSVDSSLNSVGIFIQASSTNTWDANGLATGPQDGNGNWDDGSMNWWNGAGNGVWADETVAVFGSGTSTNCTVTLTTNVAPYAITFNANAGGTYTLTGTNAILMNIPGSPLTITANANATIGASLVGPSGLVKQGSGTLTLTALNNYSGPTLVNAGTLKLGTNTALGSSVSVASGASLDLNGQDLTTAMFGQPVNLSGTVGGTVALTNSSPARGQLQDVQLSADTTITGPNTVFVRGTSGENGILNLNGHTLNIAGNVLLDGVNMTGPGNITMESGTLQLIDYYGNSQRDTSLAGTGNLTINAGAAVMTYRWGAALNLSMPLILNGGMLGSGWPGPNGATFACPILVNSNSLIDFDGGYGSGILAGNITGPGGLTVTGDGNVRTFTGTNSYGWTTINGGTLQIGYGGSSGTLGRGCVTNNATLAFNRTDFVSVTNQISGPGALSQNGVGTVALCGTNTYTGLTSINAGVLQIGNGGATGTLGLGSVANHTTLVFERTGSLPVTNQISGPGALAQNGAGTVVLYGSNTYTGNTILGAGVLNVSAAEAPGSSGPLGQGGLISFNGGTLQYSPNNNFDYSARFSPATNQNFSIDTAGQDISFAAGLVSTNGGNVTKLGAGTLTLNASNNYSGTTLVAGGILQLGTNTALGANVLVTNGGMLDLNGQDLTASMFDAPVAISSLVPGATSLTNSSPALRGELQDLQLDSDTTVAGPNTVFVRGTTGENGILNLNGHTLTIAGNLLLDGVNMTGPGNITVESGTLQLIDYYGGAQRDTSLAGTGNLTINAGAAVMTYRWGTALNLSMPLILNGGMLGSGWPGPNGAVFTCPILVNSNSLIDFDGGYGSGILAGNITGPGGLVVTGDGNARTFTGTNSYGWTTIDGGILQIGDGGASGTLGRGCVTNNANLVFNRTGFLPVTNLISGPGALYQNGTGTVALYGTNTYAGSTTVNAGTLLVNGALAGGPVTVAAQGTLGGSGTLYGPTTIQPGGLMQPGCSNLTTLTLNNTLSLGGNVLFALNRTNAQTSSRIAGLSTVSCGGTLTVTNVGPNTFASGDTLYAFASSHLTRARSRI